MNATITKKNRLKPSLKKSRLKLAGQESFPSPPHDIPVPAHAKERIPRRMQRPYSTWHELYHTLMKCSPPRPRPGQVPSHSLDGAPFLHTCFNGDPSGERAGPGAGAGNPKKKTPLPLLFNGAGRGIGPGARIFWDPRGPVTNTHRCYQCLLPAVAGIDFTPQAPLLT